jgi:type IV pilus assembly protein PilW
LNRLSGPARAAHGALRRGLSLVELMIGVTIGLFVVAAATVMVSGQLGENRRLLLETQLQQDMRATTDVITRQLRRISARQKPSETVHDPFRPAMVNPEGPASPASGVLGAGAEFEFRYSRPGVPDSMQKYKLEGGVIRSFAGATWQDLTDGGVMVVETFTITIEQAPPEQLPCPNLCAGGTTVCWPVVHVRDYIVDITARSKADLNPPVRRSMRSTVRARNDWVDFVGGVDACPK